VIGVMDRYLFAPEQREQVLDALADPATHLVTLTITGAGYNLDAEGGFAVDDPTVAEEMEDPGRPDTVFGYLVEALDRRRQAGLGPFTVLSCDNIPPTAPPPARWCSLSPRGGTRSWPGGSRSTAPSRTAWSTGSPRRPRRGSGTRSPTPSASRTGGR
jgi:hypothetical protein